MATAGKDLSAYKKETLPDASTWRFGLVLSEWNDNITGNLAQGAHDALTESGVPTQNIHRMDVPGSFELVAGSRKLCETQQFDAIVAIGSVIQGETRHFDFVCQGTANGIAELNSKYNTPVIFCVLTDNTLQQAIDRSGGVHGNKGVEAAIAAIQMAAIKNQEIYVKL